MRNWSVGLLAAGAWLFAGCDGGAMQPGGADDDGRVGAVAAEPEGDGASLVAGDEKGDVESSVPSIFVSEPSPREPIGHVPCGEAPVGDSPNPCTNPPPLVSSPLSLEP
ncbi:MAG TPA: hypothetical protein VFS43_46555 [Polyangiaceae bacterium]|nr:hypothetical protein [Polyangiaceae bacterium]